MCIDKKNPFLVASESSRQNGYNVAHGHIPVDPALRRKFVVVKKNLESRAGACEFFVDPIGRSLYPKSFFVRGEHMPGLERLHFFENSFNMFFRNVFDDVFDICRRDGKNHLHQQNYHTKRKSQGECVFHDSSSSFFNVWINFILWQMRIFSQVEFFNFWFN